MASATVGVRISCEAKGNDPDMTAHGVCLLQSSERHTECAYYNRAKGTRSAPTTIERTARGLCLVRCMDYDVQNFTRRCTATGREFTVGESYYSVLVSEGAELKRCDYSVDAWQGPPPGTIGYWKSQVPGKTNRGKHWAPNDVMLHFFDELAEQSDKQDMRYVLTLLLIRRRVFRLEDEKRDQQDNEVLTVYCPRRDVAYTVLAVPPKQPRIDEIQQQLMSLLE